MLSLLELYKSKEVNHISGFLDFMVNMDVAGICDGYRQLRDQDAPQRAKPYFVESHNGISGSGVTSNRDEEHLALAIFNESRANGGFKLPDGRLIDFIDYQTPLKAKRGDKGVGKVDLFGVIDKKYPTVVELKIQGVGSGKADSPLRALLEGLAYSAIIEKNISKITAEAVTKFGLQLVETQSKLVVLAPDKYWNKYLQSKKAGDWLPELVNISNQIRGELNIEIILLAMTDSDFEMGLDGNPARLMGNSELVLVESLVQ